ncbi:hypothetical protein TorRG33x02_270580 [Trema orientale]|uniref:Uncharacterized protein n=1 Tax=Trema orientale TaxID=63057 RepID=A0A2P5CWX7_TREOI|nr:hypothetical protein TorRG33x02_270580 [Trema orientale]
MLGGEVGLRLEMMENTLPWETVIFQTVITSMLVIFDKFTMPMVKTQVVSLQKTMRVSYKVANLTVTH